MLFSDLVTPFDLSPYRQTEAVKMPPLAVLVVWSLLSLLGRVQTLDSGDLTLELASVVRILFRIALLSFCASDHGFSSDFNFSGSVSPLA